MDASKVERYSAKLAELRALRYGEENDEEKEKAVLEVMDVLWESMTLEERKFFSETNHLSWPPPRRSGDEE